MKILIEESVLREALEALMLSHPYSNSDSELNKHSESITALRSALDAAECVEPVAWICQTINKTQYLEWPHLCHENDRVIPLYPAPAVPEDEIEKLRAERDELYRMNLAQAQTINKLEEFFGVNK